MKLASSSESCADSASIRQASVCKAAVVRLGYVWHNWCHGSAQYGYESSVCGVHSQADHLPDGCSVNAVSNQAYYYAFDRIDDVTARNGNDFPICSQGGPSNRTGAHVSFTPTP